MFEIKLKLSTWDPSINKFSFTFDYEVRSIPHQLFRFRANSYQHALSLVDSQEIEYLNSISSPTLGEIIDED